MRMMVYLLLERPLCERMGLPGGILLPLSVNGAAQVWNNRTCTNVQPQADNTHQPEQIQDVATECYLVENPEDRFGIIE